MICTSFRQAFNKICTHSLTSRYWSPLPPFQISFLFFLKITYKMNTCCYKSWIYYVEVFLCQRWLALCGSFILVLRMPWISVLLLIFLIWAIHLAGVIPFTHHSTSTGVFRCFTSSKIHIMAYYCQYVKDLTSGNL